MLVHGAPGGRSAARDRRAEGPSQIPTGLVDGLEKVTREVTVELRPTTCPMRVDDLEAKRCAINGGPIMLSGIGLASPYGSYVWQ